MQTITEQQLDNLIYKIYESLIHMDVMGLDDMASCTEEADRIAKEWCKENNITITDE